MNDYQIIEKWVDFLREMRVTTPAALDLATIRNSWVRVRDYKSNKERRQLFLELLEGLIEGYCQTDKYPRDWVENPRFKELIIQTGAFDSNHSWAFKDWAISQLKGVKESHIDNLESPVISSLSKRFREIRSHDAEALEISNSAYQHLNEKKKKINEGRSINEENPRLSGYGVRRDQLDKYENEILNNHQNRYLEIESYRAQVESCWKDNCVNAIIKSLIDIEIMHHLPPLEELSKLISNLPEIDEFDKWDEMAATESWNQAIEGITKASSMAFRTEMDLKIDFKDNLGPPRTNIFQVNFNAPDSNARYQQVN